jgi:hypothetical protein
LIEVRAPVDAQDQNRVHVFRELLDRVVHLHAVFLHGCLREPIDPRTAALNVRTAAFEPGDNLRTGYMILMLRVV